jgi:HD domain
MVLNPGSVEDANLLLVRLGAPPRLLRHVALVGEAGERLLELAAALGLPIDATLVRVGIVLHDAGKILVSAELDAPGGEHEPRGHDLLLEQGVSPAVARICLSHARWSEMAVSLEELLVALSDKLWKGVRNAQLEERVISEAVKALGRDRWELFVELDRQFEEIAAEGTVRLERSRV